MINPFNVVLAALFAAGVFALVTAIGYQRPIVLSETERLYGGGEARLSPLQRLQRQLDAARFNITASEFLRVSAALAVLAGIGAYALSGAMLAGVLGCLCGGAGYWLYLSRKATQALEAYEDELPQVVARLIAGAKLGNAFVAAAEHVAKFGPFACRDDWSYMAAQLKANAEIEQVFRVISQKRGSQLLNSIFELLLIQQQRGTGLSEVLPLIQETLEERVRTVRRARTKLSGPIRELWIVCGTPFVSVILLRFLSPEFAEIYSTWAGQLVLLVGWGITLLAFVLAHRSFSAALRRETNFYGALRAEPRSSLQKISPAPESPSHVSVSGQMPAALSGLTARTSERRSP
jgi:tight adherence protein B